MLLYCVTCYYTVYCYIILYYLLLNHEVGFKNPYFLLKFLSSTVLSQKLEQSNLKQIESPL